MPISWNEIRHNAIKFSREWAGAKSESAEKQTNWNEFFQVFDIKRRAVASFEESVTPKTKGRRLRTAGATPNPVNQPTPALPEQVK